MNKRQEYSTKEADVNLAIVFDSVILTTCKKYLLPILELKYNKGWKGDGDGRKRIRALRELKYVHNRYNPSSSFRMYPSDEIDKMCFRDAGLPTGYRISKELLDVIEAYKEEFRTDLSDIVDGLIDHLNSNLKLMNDISALIKDQVGIAIKDKDLEIAKLCMDLMKDSNTAIKAIPNILEQLNKAKEEEKKQIDFKSASKDKTSFETQYMTDWITGQL